MDPKELKKLLKEAKTALKENDHTEAVKLCKTILKAEPNNYTALVITGAAYSNQGKTQQCLEAYKHAISSQPNSVLAWQGLVQHYEKIDKTSQELIEGYKRIAAFHESNSDEDKFVENTVKMAKVLVRDEEYNRALKVLMRISKKMKLPLNVALLVVQIIGNIKGAALSIDEEQLHIDALETLIKNPESTKEDHYKTMYALLYKRKEIKRLVEECLSASHVYNSIYHPLEYLCRLYVENWPEVTYTNEIASLSEKLFKLYPSSINGYFAKGKYFCSVGRLKEGIDWLKEGLEAKFNPSIAQILIECKLNFGDFTGALETISLYRNKASKDMDSETALRLKAWEVQALLGSDLDLGEKALIQWKSEAKDDCRTVIRQLEAKLSAWKLDRENLKSILTDLEERDVLIGLYRTLVQEKEDIYLDIANYLESVGLDYEVLILAGLTLWKMEKFTEAVTAFRKLSDLSKSFHPLPAIYWAKLHRMAGDLETAMKTLEDAYKLYPSIDAGCLLSDLYFQAGFEEKNRELLTAASKRLRKVNSKWTWLRLGLLYLQSGDANEATVVLQSAVRADYSDAHLWETLADAYLARGSFHSALKSYNKALELNGDPIYPTYKIGVLYQELNDHQQAIKTFENLLAQAPNYVPAILELAKTQYKVAQYYFSVKRDVSGIRALEECIRWSVRSLEIDKKVLAWKMIGDCSLLVSDILLETELQVPANLTSENSDHGPVTITVKDLIQLGTDAFHMALRSVKSGGLLEAQADLYHDVGHSYRQRALKCAEGSEQKDLLLKAISAVKIAISKRKNNYIYWNTLGVIASHPALSLGSLAQHAFIKSIHVESNNPVAWTNLGFLHYHAGSYANAHHCFSRAQMNDPSYSYCWAGESLVAEALKPVQAMDEYRHTCLLDSYPDLAPLGYSDWVCRMLAKGEEDEENYIYSILKCEAVQTSHDLISLYCARHPRDPYGLMYQGIFAGILGLLNSSATSFKECLSLLTKDQNHMVDTVKCNLAAVLLNQGEMDEAFTLLQDIECPNFTVCCVAAEAFDKAGNYEMCVQAYEQAVEQAPDASKKAEALIGLGIVFGKCKGLEEAKTYIFQGWRLAREKIAGLLAIVALSLQKEELSDADRVIAKAVYDEIQPIADYELKNDVATLSSAWHIAQGDLAGARNCILRAARLYPWNPSLWNTLAHFLIECHERDASVRPLIRKAVGRANVFERTSEQLVALSYLLEDNVAQGLVYAKKVVHSEPYSPTAWAVLILALYKSLGQNPSGKILKYTISAAERALKLCSSQSSAVAGWLTDYVSLTSQLL